MALPLRVDLASGSDAWPAPCSEAFAVACSDAWPAPRFKAFDAWPAPHFEAFAVACFENFSFLGANMSG